MDTKAIHRLVVSWSASMATGLRLKRRQASGVYRPGNMAWSVNYIVWRHSRSAARLSLQSTAQVYAPLFPYRSGWTRKVAVRRAIPTHSHGPQRPPDPGLVNPTVT